MKPKGGRGLKAPYTTCVRRIPLPLVPIWEAYEERWRTGGYDESPALLTKEEAISLAKEILKQKKSARVSLEKLVTGIFGVDIEL